MKKIIGIILICATLLSMLVLPISADDSGTAVATVDRNISANGSVTVDGAMSEGEGYNAKPVAFLDKNYGISDGTQNTVARGEVYVTADANYIYVFFKLYKDYNVVFDSATTQTFIKAYFGEELGAEEICFWGTRNGGTRTNPSTKGTWPNGVDITDYSGKALNNNSDGTYTVEAKLPIPATVKTAMASGTQEIKLTVCQGLATGGGYISDTVMTEATEDTGRNAKDYGITLNLQRVTSPTVVGIYGKTVTLDGTMSTSEGWAELPYMRLEAKTTDGTTVGGVADGNWSSIRYSVDGEKLYAFFETSNKTSERLYLQFAFDGRAAGTKDYFLNAEIDLTNTATPTYTLSYGDGQAYAAGDAMYDGFALALKATSTKLCAEIAVPLPTSVAQARLEGTATVKTGIYERFTAAGTEGNILSTGYAPLNPSVELVLPECKEMMADLVSQWVQGTKADADYENLKGLSVNVFGDSYFTGGDKLEADFTWAGLLADKYDWTLNNFGVDGNMISEFDDIDSMPMVKRYRQLSNNSPDLVIVTGGYNDFKANATIGDDDSRDTKTYCGALNVLIDGLKAKYPESKIIFVTPWLCNSVRNASGNMIDDYARAMERICASKGISCYKAYDASVSGIDTTDPEFREQYTVAADDWYHLNLEGHKLAMAKVESFLNTCVEEWINAEESGENGGNGEGESNAENTVTDTETKETAADTTEEKKKGCGSSVGASALAVLAITALAAVCFTDKRKRDN